MSYIIAIVSSIILLGSNLCTTNLEAASKSSSKSSSRILPKKSECAELKADHVQLFVGDNGIYWHGALYDKGGPLKHNLAVMTVINDPSGRLQPGTQLMEYGKDYKVFSVATSWNFLTTKGVTYQTYVHDNCTTYSTDFEQFILTTK